MISFPKEYLPEPPGDDVPESVQQPSHPPLLAVVGDDGDEDNVPGEALETGGDAVVSVEERVSLDDPEPGPSEGVELVQYLSYIVLTGNMKLYEFSINVQHTELVKDIQNVEGVLIFYGL